MDDNTRFKINVGSKTEHTLDNENQNSHSISICKNQHQYLEEANTACNHNVFIFFKFSKLILHTFTYILNLNIAIYSR